MAHSCEELVSGPSHYFTFGTGRNVAAMVGIYYCCMPPLHSLFPPSVARGLRCLLTPGISLQLSGCVASEANRQ